jgi:hypothetical protein
LAKLDSELAVIVAALSAGFSRVTLPCNRAGDANRKRCRIVP